MKTFKAFLREAQAPGSPEQVFEPIADLKQFLLTHCKDSLWMLHEDKPLYRGFTKLDVPLYQGNSGNVQLNVRNHSVYVDLRRTKRISEETSNWYTEIFDNHPEMGEYPKRSKSMICSTDAVYTKDFGVTYAVIPIDGARIGMVNKSDIWAVKPTLFGAMKGVRFFNDDIQEIVNSALGRDFNRMADFDLLKVIDAELKTKNGEMLKMISSSQRYGIRSMTDDPEFEEQFLESILDAYSPTKLWLKSATTKNFRPKGNQEIWFDKGAVVISLDKWKKLITEFN